MARIRSKREVPPGQAAPAIVLDADLQAALDYFSASAPLSLPKPDAWPAPTTRLAFERRTLAPPGAPPAPAVSNVELLDLDGDSRLELVVCDMRHGMVLLGRPYDPAAGLTLLAQVPNPDHATLVDLDRDGLKDLIISDLGEFFPWDHGKGGLVWLRGQKDGTYQKFGIGGLPRVADVEAADFDNDGDLDLVVAAFGYRETGQILRAREPDDELGAAGVRGADDRRARRGDQRAAGRSRRRRTDGLRRASSRRTTRRWSPT